VNASGCVDYIRIQDAVNASGNGDTITVDSGYDPQVPTSITNKGNKDLLYIIDLTFSPSTSITNKGNTGYKQKRM
jgi:hypothetical protein